MRRKIRKAKVTKGKVRNATCVTYDGINFKSKLEQYCYMKLKEHNIDATYEGTTFTLIEDFTYNGEKVRKMQYTPDFIGTNFIIECKGHANESFPLRYKVFKYYLWKNNLSANLYLPRNKKQIDEVVKSILEKI